MKIIVPTDFSDTAASALCYGAFLAKQLDYEIEVVHIHDGYGHTEDPEIRKGDLAATMNVQHKLDEFIRFNVAPDAYRQAPDTAEAPRIKSKEVTGTPAESILSIAKDKDAALIVMGGVGSGLVSTTSPAFGSVAKSVALEATIPVLLIPQNYGDAKVKRAAIAFSDLPPLREITEKADFIINALKPDMRLVHIQHKDEIRESIKHMDELSAAVKAGLPGFSVELDILPPAKLSEAIVGYVKAHELDLLIVGHRKRGLFSRLFVPSNVSPVLDVSPVPVMVVPTQNY